MTIHVRATQESFDASWRLLQRVFPDNERNVPNLVFGTTEDPIPIEFIDSQNPKTIDMAETLKINMAAFTTQVTVHEMHLDATQVDQLDVQDPRIAGLKQRVLDVIAQIPPVQRLRAERIQVLKLLNNATLQN